MRGILPGLVLALLVAFPAAPLSGHGEAAAAAATQVIKDPVQESRQNQGDPDATYWPQVDYPIGNRHGTGRTTYLVLRAGHDAWGHALRRFGAYVNSQHLGVRVLLHHTCSEAPSDPCVILREDAPASCQCYAQEGSYVAQTQDRAIQVRPDVHANFYAIVAHEFGHVLGMEHHDQHGVDGAWANEVTFSSAERQALVAMYRWNHTQAS